MRCANCGAPLGGVAYAIVDSGHDGGAPLQCLECHDGLKGEFAAARADLRGEGGDDANVVREEEWHLERTEEL